MFGKPKITSEYPPENIYKRCVDKFGVDFKKGVVFTVGKNIHCYDQKRMTPDLLKHELVHVKQQKEFGVQEWWDKYLEDSKFRLDQELEAYKEQYRFIKTHYPRHQRNFFIRHIVKDLSGSMYGRLLSKKQARQMISEE